MDNHFQPTWYAKLFKEADNAPLILFRVLFGFLLFCHCVQFIGNGLNEYFIQPSFVFTSAGFEFLQHLRGEIMYYYFAVMALLGLLIMLGLFYRFAIIAFTILWQIAYLVQVANYNHHFYLILLLCYIMVFMPANRYFSLDTIRKPTIKRSTCPQWIFLLFIAQVIIVYFYAGIYKLNPDWLSGAVYRSQHAFKKPFPIVGSLYFNPLFKYLIIWGGLLFDLLISPFLLIKRFRKYAFVIACLFHLLNSFLFNIGIFPYLSIALMIFFFNPNEVSNIFYPNKKTSLPNLPAHALISNKRIVYLLALYLFIQLILPLRASLYTGNTYWTDEGYRLGWRMILRTKAGVVHFTVKDTASKKTWVNVEQSLTIPQQKILAISPNVIWQYAQHLRKDFAEKGFNNVQVYASSWVKMNDNPAQPLVDSTIDLSKTKLNIFKQAEWVLPFKKMEAADQ